MIFLATASGLMMARVRSTAILGLRPNKCEETHNYTMSRVPAWEPGRRKTRRAAALQKQKRIDATFGWKRSIRLVLPLCLRLASIRAHVGDFKSTIVGQALRERQRDP